MNTAVFGPCAASVLRVGLSRVLVRRLRRCTAAWAPSAAMPPVAVCTVGALVVLACPLPDRAPLVATLGRGAPSADVSPAPVISALALAALAWSADRLGREVRAPGVGVPGLDQHHARPATVTRLSAAPNPLLTPTAGDLRFVLERALPDTERFCEAARLWSRH